MKVFINYFKVMQMATKLPFLIGNESVVTVKHPASICTTYYR